MSRQSLVKARCFYVMTEYCCVAPEFSLRQGFYVATKYFYVATEYFYVTIEFGLGQGFYVATKCFYAVIKFGQGQEFLCCDRVLLRCNRVWPR